MWHYLLLSKAENLTPKKRVNRDKPDFATKKRMFGLLTIDEGAPLSMTAGRATSAGLIKSPLPQNIYRICQCYRGWANTFQNQRQDTFVFQHHGKKKKSPPGHKSAPFSLQGNG